MGALALPSHWIPEDDLLLKNAIEAGASLESLAKGAVQFSRRFTIKELQDRWLALLYDPIVSAKAAEQMVELERSASNLLSKSNRADNFKGSKNSQGKRKAESVRRCYYALRKSDALNGDSNYHFGPGSNCYPNGAEAPASNNMLGVPVASHFGLEHDDFSKMHNVFPQVIGEGADPCAVNEYPIEQHHDTLDDHMEPNTMIENGMDIKEIPGHNMFEGIGIQSNQVCSRFEGNTIFNPDCETSYLQYTSAMPAMPDWKAIEGLSEIPDHVGIRGENITTGDPSCDDLKNLTGSHESFLDDFSLFNFCSEDEGMLDSITTHLLESPNDVSEERLSNMLEVKEPAAKGIYIDIPSSTGPEEKNDTVDAHLGDVNLQITSDASIPTSAACAVNSEFPEFGNGVICCTLNTEDPEIPCNDDVFPSKPRPSSLKRTQSEANNSSLHGKDTTGTQSSGKGFSTSKKEQKRFGESHPTSQTQVLDAGPSSAVDELGVKYETLRAETNSGPRNTSSGYGGPGQSLQVVKTELSELPLFGQPCCSVSEKSSQVAAISHLQTAILGTNQEGQTSLAHRNQELQALGPVDCMVVEPGGEPVLSDAEEHVSENDTDIPYFSDVESLILDMDLGPEDQDFFCSREVATYQQENMKRAIIRLEQNAHSYMQRALTSHAAFAILYGRHSKHYIKKAEVLLGRATDDVPVDIDLGREGRANKISRRQAIIKMDKDGAFNLKNTGKCSIYVNSKEIFLGQSLLLQSNCLIEIRGMPFIFEINQERIKQYLDNAAHKLVDKRPHI